MNTKKTEATKFLEKLNGGPVSFGQMVESLRLCDEVSQVDLAKKLEISRSNLCAIEKGHRNVSLEMAAHFAKKMGYPVDFFVKVAIEDHLRKAGLKISIDFKAA
jgi:transcriptional regulator with XRE-family HTH domain